MTPLSNEAQDDDDLVPPVVCEKTTASISSLTVSVPLVPSHAANATLLLLAPAHRVPFNGIDCHGVADFHLSELPTHHAPVPSSTAFSPSVCHKLLSLLFFFKDLNLLQKPFYKTFPFHFYAIFPNIFPNDIAPVSGSIGDPKFFSHKARINGFDFISSE